MSRGPSLIELHDRVDAVCRRRLGIENGDPASALAACHEYLDLIVADQMQTMTDQLVKQGWPGFLGDGGG